MNFRKLLAMLLALAMTLAAVPGLADTITINVLPPVATEAPAEAAAAEEADPVMVTVNGTAITKSVVEAIAGDFYNYYVSNGYNLTEDDVAYLMGMGMQYAVQMMVLDQKGAELGVLPLSEEAIAALAEENHATWEQAVSYYMTGYFGITAESTEEQVAEARATTLALLESMGYTERGELEAMIQQESYNAVHNYIVKDAVVTDEVIRAAYNEQVAADEAQYKDNIYFYEVYTRYYGRESTYVPEGYRAVIQILLPVDEALLAAYNEAETALSGADPTATDTDLNDSLKANADAAKAAAMAYIQPTYDEIVAKFNSGVSFQELIAEYNTDPGMTDPDTLANGYMVHKDSVLWDPSFTAAAMSLDSVGQMSAPYLGTYGAYVVYYLRDVPGGAVPLTDAKLAELREAAQSNLQEELFDSTMDAWMNEAAIEYTEAGEAIRVVE